ncbi:MAG TPA: non-heme iron oxygenase ferredoxin subunit [Nevskiales bacterium]|nr:non-heme iron oxygenase ferredoxin subunit [Nevskiales bacterium]
MSDWVTVAPATELPPGSCRVVEVDDAKVAVYNLDGRFYAIEDVCTHDGGELASGQVENGQVICPRHGARFCIRTGAVLAPPAYEPLHCFPVQVVGGIVSVRDDRWD